MSDNENIENKTEDELKKDEETKELLGALVNVKLALDRFDLAVQRLNNEVEKLGLDIDNIIVDEEKGVSLSDLFDDYINESKVDAVDIVNIAKKYL